MAPLINSIVPASGSPGARVVINGTGFDAASRVVFGTLVAPSVYFVSSTRLEVLVPNVGADPVTVKIINPDLTENDYVGFEVLEAPGWGFDPFGQASYGASALGTVSIRSALALSTREVEVEVSGLVRDNSPYLEGDALNPNTWMVQRLDTNAFLHVVSVTQSATYKYVLLTLEEFAPANINHRVSSTTLLDAAGASIVSPRSADFAGMLAATQLTEQTKLAARRLASQDIANSQQPLVSFFAGTLQIDASGDYKTVTAAELVKKLIYRRLVTTPGDFSHLPGYGVGIRLKEPLPTVELSKLKAQIEQQILLEPEVDAARVTLLLGTDGVLTIRIAAQLKKTGEDLSLSIPVKPETGVTF